MLQAIFISIFISLVSLVVLISIYVKITEQNESPIKSPIKSHSLDGIPLYKTNDFYIPDVNKDEFLKQVNENKLAIVSAALNNETKMWYFEVGQFPIFPKE